MSLGTYATPEPTPMTVPVTEFRRVCRERDEARAKLSAVAAIVQNPTFTWKEKASRAAVALALEVQRPADDPACAFPVDTGQLAKNAGLIPPTPRDDQEASRAAFKGGRKLAGEVLQDLAAGGAFEAYHHVMEETERETGGKIISSIVVSTPLQHTELLSVANKLPGTRKLGAPRGKYAPRKPYECPHCHSENTSLDCLSCGNSFHTEDLKRLDAEAAEEARLQTLEADEEPAGRPEECSHDERTSSPHPENSHRFQTLETLGTTNTGGGDADRFQSLEPVMPAAPVVDSDDEPAWLPPLPGTLPQDLLSGNAWVFWRPEWRDGKWTKVPRDPRTGGNASSTDSETWGSLNAALAAMEKHRGAGIGRGLMNAEGVTVFDFDKCRDPQTGVIEPWARRKVDELASYTELSPSGRGLHVWVRGNKPAGSGAKWTIDGHKVEVYDDARYMTVTGHHLEGTPWCMNDRSEALETLWEECRPQPRQAPRVVQQTSTADDTELIRRMSEAGNGATFSRLWYGDWSGYPSQSEADLALCRLFAFRVGPDPVRIDRLFRTSGLLREKWDRPACSDGRTYGELTIAKAVQDA